ncbi:MAG: hypothetical protein KGH75_05855 [Rhodospirillales bacterium]|nr:hypothetical protein [Rhodospirillales bacterium]
MNDLEREREIAGCAAVLESDASSQDKAQAWKAMQQLIAARSPEQVLRMERERGLN